MMDPKTLEDILSKLDNDIYIDLKSVVFIEKKMYLTRDEYTLVLMNGLEIEISCEEDVCEVRRRGSIHECYCGECKC